MRKGLLIILLAMMSAVSFAQNGKKLEVRGKIVDSEGEPIAYTTIICKAIADSSYVDGTISDNVGEFSLSIKSGEYNLTAEYIGYKSYSQQIELKDEIYEVGTITLEEDAIGVDEVVVRSKAITRKADRFIVNLKGSAATKGQNAYEALKYAPGVTTNNGLSINGNGGTILYVNGRHMNMSSDEIENYLSALDGEDVEKIEVIPVAGVEYDASATGGVIRVTLKRQSEAGYSGSLSTNHEFNGFGYISSRNSGNISYRKNHLSLYSSLSYSKREVTNDITETTEYLGDSDITNITENRATSDYNYLSGEINSVYEISDKQSIGLVANYSYNNESSATVGTNDRIYDGTTTYYSTEQLVPSKTNTISATADYNLKLDTLGSTFRISADYKYNDNENSTTFYSYLADMIDPNSGLYNSYDSNGSLASANADFSIVLSEKSTFKTGLKYFNMTTSNNSLYHTLYDNDWVVNESQSDLYKYHENVGAIYADYSFSSAKWAFGVGLRGEYTSQTSESNIEENRLDKQYFNLFPNLNVMYQINPEKGHSLVLNGSQKFTRPSFSQLQPFTLATSEYSYIIGNPQLDPTIITNVSLSQTLFHKYSATLTYSHIKDEINQMSSPSDEEDGVMYYQHINMDSNEKLSLSLFAPITVTKWLTLMVNLQGYYQQSSYQNSLLEIVNDDIFSGLIYGNAIFSIPKICTINLDGYRTGAMMQGNFVINGQYAANASISRDFFENKLSVTLKANNFIMSKAEITTNDPQYNNFLISRVYNQTVGLSLRYNFSNGKKQNFRKASSSSEYTNRL